MTLYAWSVYIGMEIYLVVHFGVISFCIYFFGYSPRLGGIFVSVLMSGMSGFSFGSFIYMWRHLFIDLLFFRSLFVLINFVVQYIFS